MERGTMEKTLLQDHGVGVIVLLRRLTRLGRMEASSGSRATPDFSCRSGDEMAEGGHIIVASIGHCIFSSMNIVICRADAASGNTHMVPMT